MPIPLAGAISGGMSLAGLLGSLFGGQKKSPYDQLIDDIIAGKIGGISPDLMNKMSANMRSQIGGVANTQRARTGEDFNARNMTQSGLLSNAYQDINEAELGAISEGELGLQLQDAQMRQQSLMAAFGMVQPNDNQGMWGDILGYGLSGLMNSFGGGNAQPRVPTV